MNKWQKVYCEKHYNGKTPRTKVGKEEIELLGKIKETLAQQGVRTIFTGLSEPAYKKMISLGILDGSEEKINRGNKLEAVEYAQAIAHGDDQCACMIIREHDKMLEEEYAHAHRFEGN